MPIPPTTGLDMGTPSSRQTSLEPDPHGDRHRRRVVLAVLAAFSVLTLMGGVRLALTQWFAASPDPWNFGLGLTMVLLGLPLPLYLLSKVRWLALALHRSKNIRCIHCGYCVRVMPTSKCPECAQDPFL